MKKFLFVILASLILVLCPVCSLAKTYQENRTYCVKQVINPTMGKVFDENMAKKAKWKSSDKDIISVTSDGIATAHRKGTATLTAKYNKNTYIFHVSVKNYWKPINMITEKSNNLSFQYLKVGPDFITVIDFMSCHQTARMSCLSVA